MIGYFLHFFSLLNSHDDQRHSLRTKTQRISLLISRFLDKVTKTKMSPEGYYSNFIDIRLFAALSKNQFKKKCTFVRSQHSLSRDFPIKWFIPFIQFLYQFFASPSLFILRGRNTIVVLSRITTWRSYREFHSKKGWFQKKLSQDWWIRSPQ